MANHPELPDTASDLVILGRISAVFGIKGWLKLFSHTEPREAILDYRNCLVRQGKEWKPWVIAEGKRHGNQIIVRIDDVDDRDAAMAWVGADIGIRRADLPDAGAEHYYWSDLEGLAVVNQQGRTLGTVDYMLSTGANDVMVVKGEQEVLIPFVIGQYVCGVDLAEGVIQVEWDWTDED